ncbi:MAG TPA: hypothetical protein VMW24_09860, partial [Sedimentisphaerales bacterium]|nr:hypothetical protein [Sedimentisphaerales bacterium]
NTDHDIWLCDGYVDQFMDRDNKTLVLRRQSNLSHKEVLWERRSPRFRYSRLRPGQEKMDSLSLTVPVTRSCLFDASLGNAESAQRIAVDIGFYNEDLPTLILQTVEMAEKLTCDIGPSSAANPSDEDTMELFRRFFGGVFIAKLYNLKSFEDFRNSVASGGDEIVAPYLWQMLNGEQVLRMEIDNVSIPYRSNYPPLAGSAGKGTKDPQGKKTDSGAKLAKADSKKPLKQEDSGTGK